MARPLKVFLSYTAGELDTFYSAQALDELGRHAGLVFNTTGQVLEGQALARAAEGCEIIIAHRSSAGLRATFAHAPELVAFLRGAVDVSTIDLPAASEHGVLVAHATAGFGQAVAEMGAAMVFDLARGLSRARAAYARGQEPVVAKALELRGARLAVVGYGAIGRAMARIGQGLGMRVTVVDPALTGAVDGCAVAPLHDALPAADFVVCVAPSLPSTRGMFDDAAFGAMKAGSCFVNLARGELVDEDALARALDSGHLRGAGLDVGSAADQRPAARFIGRDDVVAMPHVGGMTHPARHHQAMDTVRQAIAIGRGQMPEHAINADAAFRFHRFAARRAAS